MRVARIALFATLLASGCGKTARDQPPPVVWHSLAEGEALAKRDHRLALVFFEADWSTADKELEYATFPAPEVRAELRDWVVIKVDCTDDENRETEKAKDRFRVVGVPTMIGLDFDVPLNHDLFRITEFVKPETMVAALREGRLKARQRRAAAH